MKEICLTKGAVALVDDADYGHLSAYSWFLHSGGYACRSLKVEPFTVFMHRFILNTPDNFSTDHMDGNKLNNQRSNLRICTAAQNSRNTKSYRKRANKNSEYKGVSWHKQKNNWRAVIFAGKKHIHIGSFKDEGVAAMAYNLAAINHFGKFARFNVVNF